MAGEAIKFNASINTAGFDSGAKDLQKAAARASAGISSHFGKIASVVAGIGAAFIGVRAAVQAFNAAIAMGGELDDLTKRTGLAAGEILLLQKAFELGGSSADAVGGTIDKLRRSIVQAGNESSAQAESFSALGLSVSELKNLTPTEQLEKLASAIMRVGNDSQRSAIAMDIFGKSGGELVPLFSNFSGELEKARGYLGSTPEIVTKVSETFADLGDNIAAISEKGKEFMVGLLERLAPALADLTDRLANIDAAGFGAKLSEYAEKTLAWITETFKLGQALNQIEVAIDAITSGNFGDGLKLMFLTARDTALNAINKIVAAASAAVQTIGNAVSKMFRSDGPLIHLLTTGFTIAANHLRKALYSAMADFMDAIGKMGMADTFRYEAETAARSIEMLTKGIGAQVDIVGEDAKKIFAEIPQEFGESYKANMQNPLFEMEKRTAQTADQMERVAAATRAAAFDAEAFGKALENANIDKLAGIVDSGIMSQNPDGKKFSWQGAGPSGAPSQAGGAGGEGVGQDQGGGGGGGGGMAPDRPRTRNERMAEMQGNRRARRDDDLAARHEERGAFFSALNAQERADRERSRSMDRARSRDFMRDTFGGNNIGESLRNFERDARRAGMSPDEALSRMGLDREVGEDRADVLKRFIDEQSQTPEERKRRESERGGAGGGAAGQDPMQSGLTNVLSLLKQHLPEINKKLPQHALV
jgi:hypothetical protein